MLMGLGPFRFTVPTFSLENIERKTEARVAHQAVIGARPITHLLGPGPATLSLQSTFHPLHLNRGGQAMLEALRVACEAQIPMMLVRRAGAAVGFPYGLWVLTDVGGGEEQFGPAGSAQTVTATLSLTQFVGTPRAGGLPLGLF